MAILLLIDVIIFVPILLSFEHTARSEKLSNTTDTLATKDNNPQVRALWAKTKPRVMGPANSWLIVH